MKVNKEKIYDAANLSKEQIDEILQDALPAIEEMDNLPSKSSRDISAAYERAKILFDMVKDTYSGKYKALDELAIVAAVLALIYLASPLDFIPDVVPGVGVVDDVAIMSFAIGLCAKEIKRYMDYKVSQGNEAVIDSDPYK